jgi:hypothetical protein
MKMAIDEFSNRMIGCAIAVHWHVGPEPNDGIESFFLSYRRALRVIRGSPIAAPRLSATGTFRNCGEQFGPP